MYHVLVPIDRNEERATAQADAIKRLPGTKEVHVTLLYVFSDDGTPETDPTEFESGAALQETLTEHGVPVETASRMGEPAGEILAMAEDIDADMIVLGGRKRSPLGSLLFGSVSQSVMLQANRPVTITGAEVKQDPSHRCQSCGETYYAEHETEITTCRRCGGTNVEPVEVVVE